MVNRIDVYCSAKGCQRWLYTSEPPIIENPVCDECKISGLEQQLQDADDVNLRLKMEFIASNQEVGRLRSALEKIASRRPRPLPGKCSELYGIAEQALKRKE